jgi:hypothetical protein
MGFGRILDLVTKYVIVLVLSVLGVLYFPTLSVLLYGIRKIRNEMNENHKDSNEKRREIVWFFRSLWDDYQVDLRRYR